jgi:hypothetical protein
MGYAQASRFPSPHSRSEWRGGVRGGRLCSASVASANKERPPTRLASLATLPTARFARGGREGASGSTGASPRTMRLLHQFPNITRAQRQLARLDAERAERVGDGVGHHAAHRDDPAFARALGLPAPWCGCWDGQTPAFGLAPSLPSLCSRCKIFHFHLKYVGFLSTLHVGFLHSKYHAPTEDTAAEN